MAKTFTKAPRPGSAEAIEAYERGGLGHDTATKPQTNISTEPQNHIPTRVVAEPMKRLSIDMPASLHRRFKLACTAADKVMVAEVLAFIERRTAELEGQGK
jgi:hypothetical protein